MSPPTDGTRGTRGRAESAADPVEELAAEYLEQVEALGSTALGTFLERLASEADRERMRELVSGAQNARARLPAGIRPGTLLGGRFRVLAELGSGGMGRVFSAFDTQLERNVALKVLHQLAMGDPEREAMFQKESRLLATLQHPGIVSVHELGRDGDVIFLAMDLVEGRDLAGVLSRVREQLGEGDPAPSPVLGSLLSEAIGRPPGAGRDELIDPTSWFRSVTRIAIELTRTVEAAHGRGVVHRDLKPSNIVLRGGGFPVVLDFGLAGSLAGEAGVVTQGLFGSVAYMAPEQARSRRVGSDPRTDVYQLGLVLYELLTLRRAIAGEAFGQLLERIREGRFARPRALNPLVPLELEAICLRALELDPERRYATARELREDLERYQAGLAPAALRGHRLRRWLRAGRFQLRQRGLAAGVALAVAAVGWATWMHFASAGRQLDLDFFRLPEGAAEPLPITALDEIPAGDTLGVVLESGRPAIVYTLSVFGGPGEHERYVIPTASMLAPDAVEGLSGDRVQGLRVGAGRHHVLCSTIERDLAEERIEGLWVFASHDRVPWIEEWLRRVSDSPDAALGAVPYPEALALLDEVVADRRGVSPGGLSPEERRRKFANLAAAVGGRIPWVLDDVERAAIECRAVPLR